MPIIPPNPIAFPSDYQRAAERRANWIEQNKPAWSAEYRKNVADLTAAYKAQGWQVSRGTVHAIAVSQSRDMPREERWLDTKTYAAQFNKRVSGDYTINIPGIQDIVKFPGWDSPERRRQAWERWQGSRPTSPEWVQKAAEWINVLDDIQDLVFTGLVLARPILNLLPKWIVGPLGVLLLLNDILNMFT